VGGLAEACVSQVWQHEVTSSDEILVLAFDGTSDGGARGCRQYS
jgi:hypothetical protein